MFTEQDEKLSPFRPDALSCISTRCHVDAMSNVSASGGTPRASNDIITLVIHTWILLAAQQDGCLVC